MPVAHQAAAARLGLEIGMSMQEIIDLRLNGLCEQGTCPAAQNLGERIREGPWLRKLENVSVDHGVSLLRWRSGGVEHPHDTPPYPFMPSPTFAHSSRFPGGPLSAVGTFILWRNDGPCNTDDAEVYLDAVLPLAIQVQNETGWEHWARLKTLELLPKLKEMDEDLWAHHVREASK